MELSKKTIEDYTEALMDSGIFYHLDEEAKNNTPKRAIKALVEMCSGLFSPPPEMTAFSVDKCKSTAVRKKGITFNALCPHHLLPYFGTIDIYYEPDKCYLGISKLDRYAQWASKRPITQEELGEMIARGILESTKCKQVSVNIRATHTCNRCRGVELPSETETFCLLTREDIDNEE